MLNVLLVEDTKECELLVRTALKIRYNVVCADTIAKAREELARREFALVILDVSLPDGDGFEYCAELQNSPKTKELPVVLLTSRNQPSDKVLGWNTGADDYIEKPFNVFEFQARIDAHIRKQRKKTEDGEVLVRGSLHLNLAYHEAKIVTNESEQLLSLTRFEFKLLYHLIRHQDRVISRQQLQHAVWGPLTHITDRTVDRHISQLRQKMGSEAKLIQTISGVGYKFVTLKAA